MKVAYFDCSFGISGDMMVSALLDAGLPFEELKSALQTLPITGYSIVKTHVEKNHIKATQFIVTVDNKHHHHRHLSDIIAIINNSQLPEPVKIGSIKTFELLAEAEAHVHGTTKDKIHFHEVGAVDSIIDIVSAHWCYWYLGIEKAYTSEINIGGGTIECAHGTLPVPAPATALLLQGFKVKLNTANTELTTPTGAVLIKTFTTPTDTIPPIKLITTGIGAGTKNFSDHPNIFRILIGEEESLPCQTEDIYIVQTNLDDMIPELLPPVIEALLSAGAVDAFITPIICKKGRPGYILTVMCHSEKLQNIQEIIFKHTSTLGLRFKKESRLVLDRKWETVKTPWGEVRVKLGIYQQKICQASVEFEDAYKLSKEKNIPLHEIYNFVSSNYKTEE